MRESEPKPEWRAPTVGEPESQPDATWDARLAKIEGYRLQLAQHLVSRGQMNALMVEMVNGAIPWSDDGFGALSHAHESLTREAGAVLMCLGALVSSEGTA